MSPYRMSQALATPDKCILVTVTVQTGLITAVCALVDLVLFLATVRNILLCDTGCPHSLSITAHRSSPRFQPPAVEALHKLAHVQLELAFRLEVRKRQRHDHRRAQPHRAGPAPERSRRRVRSPCQHDGAWCELIVRVRRLTHRYPPDPEPGVHRRRVARDGRRDRHQGHAARVCALRYAQQGLQREVVEAGLCEHLWLPVRLCSTAFRLPWA